MFVNFRTSYDLTGLIMTKPIIIVIVMAILFSCRVKESTTQVVLSSDTVQLYAEKHRPQLHFSPKEHWMNDPNGMVYYKGEYHLFYQHYPDGMVWGPMHWGHAISKDLVHWEHQPIALYPDTLGLIFSGSAVVDQKNTSGFGTKDNPALVAVYTYHSMQKEKAGRTDYQNQGIAYSSDNGRTWSKFPGNPVLKNQGIKDFRDPKVFWHDGTKKWVMILAVKDHVELWNSPDLKSWSKLSDFGQDYGAHGGVWECPDLFYLPMKGEAKGKWVMLVSINPGGPNGGSATQYFVGDFDGKRFLTDADKEISTWIDYGPDNYAGVTFSNAPDNRKIFLGWMSNWAYAEAVPTSPWRSAMTLPRDLSLVKVGGSVYLQSSIVKEISSIVDLTETPGATGVSDSTTQFANFDFSTSIVSGSVPAKNFTIELYNDLDQKISFGFDETTNQFFIDRSKSGKVEFSKNFKTILAAPRIANAESIKFNFVVDVSSLEIFFDDGISVMTSLHFPDENFVKMRIKRGSVKDLTIKRLKSVW
jgi:fructan beta-fructosidase